MADISLLHVSAPGCHLQGVFQIKGIQYNAIQCADLGVALPSLE